MSNEITHGNHDPKRICFMVKYHKYGKWQKYRKPWNKCGKFKSPEKITIG